MPFMNSYQLIKGLVVELFSRLVVIFLIKYCC